MRHGSSLPSASLLCAGISDAPSTEDYARLRERLKAVQAEHHIPDNVLFHFSVTP